MFLVGGNLFNSTQKIVIGSVLTGVPSIGLLLESGAKYINKETHPILRSILETAGKVIQVASAVLVITFFLGALGPVGPAIGIALGSVMVFTHILNGIAENTNDENFKKFSKIADKVVSCTSKIINTAFVAFWAFSIGGIAAVVISGLVYGGLSIATLLKRDAVQIKQSDENAPNKESLPAGLNSTLENSQV